MLFNLFHVLLVVSLLVVCLDLGFEEIRAARRTRDLIELVLRTAQLINFFPFDLHLHENADRLW